MNMATYMEIITLDLEEPQRGECIALQSRKLKGIYNDTWFSHTAAGVSGRGE